jgi:hypothetical protein
MRTLHGALTTAKTSIGRLGMAKRARRKEVAIVHRLLFFLKSRGVTLAHSFADWLQAFRRTKLYDLCAAAPLIAWYLFGVKQMVPVAAGQITLISLFSKTDASVLPFELVLSALSKICSLAFLAVLIVMFAIRRPPKLYSKGLYARFVALAGTWVSVGIVQLPPRQLSSLGFLTSVLL